MKDFFGLLKNMLNYNFILKKAENENIDRVTIEREYWQLLFLQRLYQEKNTEKIFFKGGTAIRFLFNSFRFSEDLDFTSIASKIDSENIFQSVFNFFITKSPKTIEIKKERIPVNLCEISLRYRFLFFPMNSNQKVSIRIDLSLREKPITNESSVLVPFDYPISPYPLVVHLKAEELLAEKIRAIITRAKPRDLFDIWFLRTKQISIDEKMIGKKMKYYPGSKFSYNKLAEIINGYEEKELKQDLNQFLPSQYRNFYKTIKKETLFLLPAQ